MVSYLTSIMKMRQLLMHGDLLSRMHNVPVYGWCMMQKDQFLVVLFNEQCYRKCSVVGSILC